MDNPGLQQREAAAVKATKANKDDDSEVDKGDSKQAKVKPKQATHSSKKKKKDSSLMRIKPSDDNLDEYLGLSQGQNSQEAADVTHRDSTKKSEETKSKNDPDGSSHKRVDRSPPGSAGEGPSLSSSSSYSESSDEEVSSKGKVKELPPHPLLKKHRS